MKAMARPPSNDRPSLAHEWASFRLFYRLLLAIVAVFLCSGAASPAAAATTVVAATIEVAASDGAANIDSTPEPAHHWRDGGSRPVEPKACEIDLDDDDDPLCDVLHDLAPTFQCLPSPREPTRFTRGELSIDTSRFAAGLGLPRGPPV
jgi:hypothetical protein